MPSQMIAVFSVAVMLFSNVMGQTIKPSVPATTAVGNVGGLGYTPVYIPGTSLPYIYTTVRMWENTFERSITGFARLMNVKGVYMFTPLIGNAGLFIVGNSTQSFPSLFSSTGAAVKPIDIIPVYSLPTRSGVLPTAMQIGIVPLYSATAGVEQLRSLASVSLDSTGKSYAPAASSWDAIVYRSVNPPLLIEPPKQVISSVLKITTAPYVQPVPTSPRPALPQSSSLVNIPVSSKRNDDTPSPSISPRNTPGTPFPPSSPPPPSTFLISTRRNDEPLLPSTSPKTTPVSPFPPSSPPPPSSRRSSEPPFLQNTTGPPFPLSSPPPSPLNSPPTPPKTAYDYQSTPPKLIDFATPPQSTQSPRLLFVVTTIDGFMQLVSTPPATPPVGRIQIFSNATTGEMFIPVYPAKSS